MDSICWKEIVYNYFFNIYLKNSKDLNEMNEILNEKKGEIENIWKFIFRILNKYFQLFNQLNNLKNQPKMEIWKFVVAGSMGVGKSSIVKRLNVGHCENIDHTCELFLNKEYEIDQINCLVQILDYTGSEEFTALRPQYLRQSDAVICICSKIDKNSLFELKSVFEMMDSVKESNEMPFILCINKCDLICQLSIDNNKNYNNNYNNNIMNNNEVITVEMVDQFLQNLMKSNLIKQINKEDYLFTSALKGDFVNEIIEKLVRKCRKEIIGCDFLEIFKELMNDYTKVFVRMERSLILQKGQYKKKCHIL
ncbi:hypothetical protein ABK040_002684 [Willaertia magna]